MITIILFILLGLVLTPIILLAALLPITKMIYTYGESKDDWYSSFDDDELVK
jgi:hypothetical protein